MTQKSEQLQEDRIQFGWPQAATRKSTHSTTGQQDKMIISNFLIQHDNKFFNKT